jgi:hypothetical protein
VAFIGQRIGELLKWRHIGRDIEGHNVEDKILCTASKLGETWLKSSLAICHYVKVQQLDVICETRRYRNKTAKYGLNRVFVGVSGKKKDIYRKQSLSL